MLLEKLLEIRPSTINLSTVPDFQHQHDQSLVFHFADGAVIANAVSPQTALVAGQRFAQLPRVISRQYACAKVNENSLLNGAIQCAELLRC